MMIIIIIINALKGAISSLCHELSRTRMLKWPGRNCMQIMCSTLGTLHVQHVMCHVVLMDSPAIKADKG